VSSDVIPIVLGIIIAALIFWGGRASQPRRSARFDKFQRRSIDVRPKDETITEKPTGSDDGG
jgi:hypothetical protein